MKILQVISSFPPAVSYGGAPNVAYELSKQLVKRGHQVTVYTTDVYDLNSRFNSRTNPTWMDGIEVYHFKNLSNKLSNRNFTFAPSMALKLKKELPKFDVIHLHEYRSFQAILVHHFAKKYNIPYILQAHGSLPSILEKKRLKNIFDFFFKKIVYDASKIIALNKLEAEQYINIGLNAGKIATIPNGINFSDNQNYHVKGNFREKYSIDENKKIILFLGRIHRIKGIDLLIEAYKIILNKSVKATLVIVGEDKGFLNHLKSLIKDLDFKDSEILFTGPLFNEDKFEAYIDADIYVLPSRYEMFPMTILEAWNADNPVITTDKCGISDMVKEAGIVVKYDKNSLAKAIIKIITNNELAETYSKKGNLILKTLSWENIAEKIEETYKEMVIQ